MVEARLFREFASLLEDKKLEERRTTPGNGMTAKEKSERLLSVVRAMKGWLWECLGADPRLLTDASMVREFDKHGIFGYPADG